VLTIISRDICLQGLPYHDKSTYRETTTMSALRDQNNARRRLDPLTTSINNLSHASSSSQQLALHATPTSAFSPSNSSTNHNPLSAQFGYNNHPAQQLDACECRAPL
jgi:hypothetical protein